MNGMKSKRLLALVGVLALALLLGACSFNPVPIRSYQFASSFQVASTKQWASCENLDTVFEYSIYAENPAYIESITEHYVGVRTGVAKSAVVPRSAWSIDEHRVTVQAVFDADGRFLPLADDELSAQAIDVVPLPVDPTRNNGSTRFWIEVEYAGMNFTGRTTEVLSFANCNP